MTRTTSVPRSKNDDRFYNYKMGVLEIKSIGRGSSIRTILVNLNGIALNLDRPVKYILRYFQYKLNTVSTIKDGECIINGLFKIDDLLIILDDFIDAFVLCRNCKLPETKIIVKNKEIKMNCNACGNNSNITIESSSNNTTNSTANNKLCEYILNPITIMNELLLRDTSNLSNNEIIEIIKSFHNDYSTIKSSDIIKNSIISLCKNNDVGTIVLFNSNLKLVKKISKLEKGKIGILLALEELCKLDNTLLISIQNIIQNLYQSNIISKEHISKWYTSKAKYENIIIACAQFIESIEQQVKIDKQEEDKQEDNQINKGDE